MKTATPTAANTTVYTLDLYVGGRFFVFSITSDASATATEICDAFRTAMAADAEFTALVVATGTATLILTLQAAAGTADFDVYSTGAGAIAIADTTAGVTAVATAVQVKGCRYLETTSAAGIVLLEVDMPAYFASL